MDSWMDGWHECKCSLLDRIFIILRSMGTRLGGWVGMKTEGDAK